MGIDRRQNLIRTSSGLRIAQNKPFQTVFLINLSPGEEAKLVEACKKLVGGLQQRRVACGKPHFAILSRKAEEPGSDGTQAEETVKSKTRTGDEVNE